MRYKMMRLFVMFDLPTKTDKEKREYILFRKQLLEQGFFMFQYSVYVRTCLNRIQADMYLQSISRVVPEYGMIRCICVTEKQFADMALLLGNLQLKEEVFDFEQLTLF